MIKKIIPIISGGICGNCYLLKKEKGFVLVDTGTKSKRKKIQNLLEESGCKLGNLDLILLTHGDFDHTGNCAYFSDKYKVKIAMHSEDSGMVENVDMFWNRTSGNRIMKKLVNLLFKIKGFKPDIYLDENSDLVEYGIDLKILHIPGHSKGSIGFLTSNNEFICGDLLSNVKKPEPGALIDNLNEFNQSLSNIKSLNITKIYPGHGKPFQLSSINF